jgi:hypothetical protein
MWLIAVLWPSPWKAVNAGHGKGPCAHVMSVTGAPWQGSRDGPGLLDRQLSSRGRIARSRGQRQIIFEILRETSFSVTPLPRPVDLSHDNIERFSLGGAAHEADRG